MKRLFKGFVIGIGKIVPGVSGALLAILMGVYDKGIFYINNFKENKKESIKYLFPLGVGILLSIILFSKIINYLLDKYYIMTMLFFVGLIIGTIPSVSKNINKKDKVLVVSSIIIFLLISVCGTNGNYVMQGNIVDILVLFISGLLEAIGTVVPGISSTALLMTMGTYKIIISSISNITNFLDKLNILIPFIIGIVIGIILTVKLIDYLFKKYHNKVYAVILGVLISTIIVMIINAFRYNSSLFELFCGIVLMTIGIFISSMFEK